MTDNAKPGFFSKQKPDNSYKKIPKPKSAFTSDNTDLDLSQYLGHILVETVKPFFLLLILQIPVGLDSESSYGFDFGYKILQCS